MFFTGFCDDLIFKRFLFFILKHQFWHQGIPEKKLNHITILEIVITCTKFDNFIQKLWNTHKSRLTVFWKFIITNVKKKIYNFWGISNLDQFKKTILYFSLNSILNPTKSTSLISRFKYTLQQIKAVNSWLLKNKFERFKTKHFSFFLPHKIVNKNIFSSSKWLKKVKTLKVVSHLMWTFPAQSHWSFFPVTPNNKEVYSFYSS